MSWHLFEHWYLRIFVLGCIVTGVGMILASAREMVVEAYYTQHASAKERRRDINLAILKGSAMIVCAPVLVCAFGLRYWWDVLFGDEEEKPEEQGISF